MQEILSFAFLSLGPGALLAALGLALVLTYRSSNVINFAVGATATFVAYSYYDLRAEGSFFGLDFTGGRPMVPLTALVLSLLFAVLLGLAQYVLVYRALRNASPLAKVVASSGVMLVLNAAIVLRFHSDIRAVPPVLPTTAVSFAGVTVPADRLLLLALVIVLAAGLWALYRYTKFGLSTRAVADNRRGALLLGINAGRLEAGNWVLSSLLAGAIGILAGPAEGLTPDTYTLLVVPALGAALLGGFVSFVWVTVGGVGISIVQSLVTYSQGQSWFPRSGGMPLPGIKESIPFIVIAIVLALRASSLPDRRSALAPRLPRAPRPTRVALRFTVAVVLALTVLGFGSYGWRQALINTMIGAVVCLSFVLITGFLGQITFVQLGLAGVAGFMTSRLAVHAHLEVPWGPLVAVLVAALFGVVVSIPALRLRGMQLAVVTLAGAVAITELWFNNPTIGGSVTPAVIPNPSILGVHLSPSESFWHGDGLQPTPGFGLIVLAVVAVCAAIVVNVRRSPTGSRMLAVRADEAAAAAAGVNVVTTKLVTFTLAGGIAGVAGVLYGYNFGSVTPGRFDVLSAVAFLAVAYLGGITTVTGAVVAGALVNQGVAFHAVTTWFGLSADYQPLFAGLAVLITVVMNPEGIAGFFRDRLAYLASGRRTLAASRVGSEVGVR
jgi:branched-chain amino acid transport system permease protein